MRMNASPQFISQECVHLCPIRFFSVHLHSYICIHAHEKKNTMSIHAGDEFEALIREAKRFLYDVDDASPKRARELMVEIKQLARASRAV